MLPKVCGNFWLQRAALKIAIMLAMLAMVLPSWCVASRATLSLGTYNMSVLRPS